MKKSNQPTAANLTSQQRLTPVPKESTASAGLTESNIVLHFANTSAGRHLKIGREMILHFTGNLSDKL